MVAATRGSAGIVVMVRVVTTAKRETVRKVATDTYEITVREPAQHNQANRRVQTILAEQYDKTAREVRLQTGHRTPKKTFIISRIT